MDIQTQKKLDYLEETKQLLRAAIEEKGQTINDSDSFRSYVDKVRAITTGGGSAELRYVTFKDDTGTVEYGKKAVATGDDCADPIARGVFDTPTKASTAQYTYTFSGGWATTPNGGIDSNALKAVEEDRTVYANFISAVRYYTITFYDDDGTTVLHTQSIPYGANPSHKPEKDGYAFVGWVPEVSTVTGDASYTASWTTAITFANASWAKISEISQAGEAANYFSIGDERVERINGKDVTLVIVGFDADLIKDVGNGGITIVNKNAYTTAKVTNSMSYNSNSGKDYDVSDISTTVNNLLSKFPSDLQSVVKETGKTCTDTKGNTKTGYYHVWLLSPREMTAGFNHGSQYESRLQKPYEGFTNNPTLLSYDGAYWTRTPLRDQYWYIVDTSLVNAYIANGTSPYGQGYITNSNLIRFGFCV